ARCAWAGADAEYQRYHDEEWGTALHGDRPLFEKMSLEGFQAGLSWITILRKRPRFREVFDGFDPAAVAAFGPDDVERLMQDAGIVRNRAKIEAVIG
ncbi:3-methyladenine DNA glycosylase, partial [Xanthomonas perforans]